MAKITLHRKPIMKKLFLPLWVFINEQPVGLMRGECVTVELPHGSYNIGVKLLFQLWKFHFGIEGYNELLSHNFSRTCAETGCLSCARTLLHPQCYPSPEVC